MCGLAADGAGAAALKVVANAGLGNPVDIGLRIAGLTLKAANVGISIWTLVEVRGMRNQLKDGLAQLGDAITAQASAIELVQKTLDQSLLRQLKCRIRTIESLACAWLAINPLPMLYCNIHFSAR